MKKLLAILLTVVLMLSFAACGDDDKKDSKEPISDGTQNSGETTLSGWRAVANEYELFVDKYVAAIKSGADVTAYDAEGDALMEKLETVEPTVPEAEKAEFEAEILRITAKLTDAMMDLGGDLGLDDYGDEDIDLGDDFDFSGIDDLNDELNDAVEDLEDSLADFDF